MKYCRRDKCLEGEKIALLTGLANVAVTAPAMLK
jgi:hypothetical protein